MKTRHLPNSVLPTKLYVVLDTRWHIVCEKQSDSAVQALRSAEKEHGSAMCRTAILKSEFGEPMFQ